MKLMLCILAMLCPAALADSYADWVEFPLEYPPPPQVPPGGWDAYIAEGHRHFDLVAVVDPDDHWMWGGFDAHFEGAASWVYSFWDHPNGNAIAPTETMLQFFPLMAYDSFWTSPEEYPNPDLEPGSTSTEFAPGNPIQDSTTRKQADWYINPLPPYTDEGTFTLARFNVMGLCPDGYVSYETPYGPAAELVIPGVNRFLYGDDCGTWFEFRIPLCWNIPEPSGLMLLGLGALLIRRLR